jgi:hypothetical protein
VGVGAGLDHVALFDLLVKERVETFPARALGIDLTHEREYRKSGALVTRGDQRRVAAAKPVPVGVFEVAFATSVERVFKSRMLIPGEDEVATERTARHRGRLTDKGS